MQLTLRILNASGDVIAHKTAHDEVVLVYQARYAEGDRLEIEAGEAGCQLAIAFDDAMPTALLYLTDKKGQFTVPFGDKRSGFSAKAFSGAVHRLKARLASREEISARRNLAFNPFDDGENSSLFPRGHANVETRQEAAFAARNAIDGEIASDGHGAWPYTSWGINCDPEASLTVEFGRLVRIDEIVLYLRADFPHDAWWESVTVTFPDGESVALATAKLAGAQRFPIEPRVAVRATLHKLVKAQDPSPFPALTQIEFWGNEA